VKAPLGDRKERACVNVFPTKVYELSTIHVRKDLSRPPEGSFEQLERVTYVIHPEPPRWVYV